MASSVATVSSHKELLAAVLEKSSPIPFLEDWTSVREQFRLSSKYLHFAGFYLASHPKPVRDAINAFRAALDENPVTTVEQGQFGTNGESLRFEVQTIAAKYIGGQPEDIALTPNTTTGLAFVYHGLALKSGDEILVTTHDHFVHHESVRLASEFSGASVRKFSLFDEAAAATIDEIVTRVREAIKPQTRVLGVTWVHSATGIRLPIREIASVIADANRERAESDRMFLVVDGVHGIGAVDETIAELGADFFCAGTHKWLFGPRGTGLVWAPSENWARLRPIVPTFSAVEPYSAWVDDRPPRGPVKADWITPGGFLTYEHQWAMRAAFQMHLAIGRARVATRINDLNNRIKQGLAGLPRVKLHTPRSPTLSAGICCFQVEGMDADSVVKALLDRYIIASASPYAVSYPRLSGGLMNTPEEIDKVISAVHSITSV